ncbi:VanZ family protein [Hornefia butyriciproducens]|uniref:VanZ family protein n=1 Tax=Hornefia butyriciproducens TaxID=2652293 RepID=UPI003F8B400B
MMTYVISGYALVAKALVPATAAYILFLAILAVSGNRKMISAHLLYLKEFIFLVYILSAGIITGLVFPESWRFDLDFSFNLTPFTNESLTMIFFNVLLFLPMGILLPAIFRRMNSWRNILTAAVLIPVGVEVTQMLFAGRLADIDDVIANFLGCMLGYVVYRILSALFCNRKKRSVGLGTASVLVDFIALCWGVTLRGWCLGDLVFRHLGLSAWSNNSDGVYAMSGVHYPEIVTLLLLGGALLLAGRYNKDYLAAPGAVVAVAGGVYTIVSMLLSVH